MIILLALAVLFALPPLSQAACSGSSPTLTAASASQADVDACVTIAVDGDTINVPAGSATWLAEVTWTNKNISIIGAGIDQTIITVTNQRAFFPQMTTPNTTYSWRISGFTFSGTHLSTIAVSSATANGYTKGWRIDHIKIDNTSASAGYGIFIYGVTWGLFDHIQWTGTPSPLMEIYGYLNNSSLEDSDCDPHCFGFTYWNRALNLGSDEAVYIEDSTTSFDGSTAQPLQDMEYGGAVVIRYNTFNGVYIQTHSTRGNALGGMKYEVYNNTFAGSSAFSRWGQIRSGTGVIFNNTVTGYGSGGGGNIIEIDDQRAAASTDATCKVHTTPLGACDGTSAYDGNTQNGWQCISGIGRGAVNGWDETGGTQSNTPIYGWKNGTTSTCSTGGTCDNVATINLDSACDTTGLATRIKSNLSPHSNGQYDYVNNGDTAKPGYTPYTYPHPLQGVVAYIPGISTSGAVSVLGRLTFQ